MQSDVEQLYQQIILDHARRRVGFGLASSGSGASGSVGESHQLNPVCGDEITLRVVLQDGAVSGVGWEGAGCAISMASASVLAELVAEEDRDRVIELVDKFRELMRSRGAETAEDPALGDASAFSGVSRYPARVKCAMLAWVALEEAVLAANR
ncbi:Fe-S cluster assembly sulfur transfer protein SufU [Arthrobacter sp. H5]|uniref:Fe-S cluster assembly sulfur transfer protein SufU n=1 Tax=Arthrobacter sp. H5 TaxID=1267973 RepID=UPI000489FFC3|nr:SUF system NifU family Fe-S cluster assembly protein [Arthrobacter sp. H5]